MATSPSLFGGSMSPQEMQAQLLNQRAAQFAQMTPDQQLGMMAYKAGSSLGTGLAGAFGVNVQDPMIQRATRLRELAGQYNTNTAAGLRQMADALRTQDPDMALQLSQRAAAMELEAAKMQSEQALAAQRTAAAGRERQTASVEDRAFIELAKKATPASVAAAIQAGNDISLLEIPENVKVSTYGQVLRDAGFKEGTPEFQAKMREFAAAELKGTSQGRGTTITNVLPGVKTAGDVTGLRKDVQAITKPYQEQADAAESAIELANMAIKSNNFAAVSSLSRSLAKAAGETQLSARDVEAFGVDPSLVGRVSDTVSRLAQSRPTVDTLTKLRQLAEALKKKADARIKLEEDQTIEVARSSGQFTEQQLNTVFRRRPAATTGSNQRTTRSGVKYTVEND
jgi:hypothetical protein